jgi:phytoene dehydrogenase-like protein
MSYDAVIIGAGLNGLVTAGYLARGGLRVLVLERRATLGGSTVTTEFAPGFRVDSCRHDAGWLSPRIASDLDLARHGLELLPSGGSVLALLAAGGYLRLDSDPARAAQAIERLSPADAAKWPAFTQRIARLAGFLEALYAAPAPNIDASSPSDLLGLLDLGRRLRRLGKTEMVELMRTVPMSAAELLDDWFENDALKGVVGARAITHMCQGPRSGGTAFVLLHHQVGRNAGAFHEAVTARGGIGGIATALAAAARAAGAEIRSGAEVTRIATRDGRASGVVLASGEEIAAGRVISSADPRCTFLTLCDPSQLAPEFVRAVRHIKYKGAWAKVNLALGALPAFEGAAGDDARLADTLVISPSLTYLERAYDDAKYGRVSDRPYLQARIPSLGDPSLAPAGKHVMSIHMQYAPYRLREGVWDAQARAALGDRVVATLAEFMPSLPAAVLHREVLTPLDLETGFSLPEGHAYHGELTLDQILFMRPVAGWSRHATPVPDLYLCGSGTHPGGGIAGAAGANAARRVLKDARSR